MKIFAMHDGDTPIASTALCTDHYLSEDERAKVEETSGEGLLWDEARDPELACRVCGAKGTE